MRLLFVTQVVDAGDSILGAYHGWLIELAKHFESIEVICLYEGTHTLPNNVHIHSLGKEKGRQVSLVYAYRFLMLAWKLRSKYDTVFVHMNQEYIVLAGWLWKLLRKPIFLWRNHYAGSVITDIAATFCTRVFCTSRHSYTAKYAKTVLMPVGVSVEQFAEIQVQRRPRSILFLSRMSPSKRPELLLSALSLLEERGVNFSASLYGSPLPKDISFYEALKKSSTNPHVTFHAGIPHVEAPAVFASHELYVNTSPSGMFDKTLFEAAAAGCTVIASSEDWRELAGEDSWFDGTAKGLADRIEQKLGTNARNQTALVESNSLSTLADALAKQML